MRSRRRRLSDRQKDAIGKLASNRHGAGRRVFDAEGLRRKSTVHALSLLHCDSEVRSPHIAMSKVNRRSRWKRQRAAFYHWINRDLGRVYAGLFGGALATVGLTLGSNRNTVANTALVVGGLLVALGALVPWFRHAQWKHASVEFEDPQIQRQRAEAALTVQEGENAREPTNFVTATRLYTATQALAALFTSADGFAQCQFRIFMYDSPKDRLVAVLNVPNQPQPSREWMIGEGVTGTAYRDKSYTIAIGDATSDTTFGLDTDAQTHYSDLTEVGRRPNSQRLRQHHRRTVSCALDR